MGILFCFDDNKDLGLKIIQNINDISILKMGEFNIHKFPDNETYIRINSNVKNQSITILCSLNDPDSKIIPLIFLAKASKNLGATKVNLIAPYLGYMRQDKRFKEGEAITSKIFAEIISNYFDSITTIDPHLHRYKSLDEIYSIKTKVLTADIEIANYIKKNIKNPLIIGPDEESEQWVKEIANVANAPYIVLTKTRHGDKDVTINLPDIENYKDKTPVLVDDIISTATTMIKVTQILKDKKMKKPHCIGVHPVFAESAYKNLKKSYVENIVTTNTILSSCSFIDISKVISKDLII